MFLRAERLFAVLAALMLVGCFDSRRCADHETCNYLDDDCDGRYDEDFRDETGRYVNDSSCGGCGVDCGAVFPTAATTACEDPGPPGIPTCRITSCAIGFHQSGAGGCAPDAVVLCRPCRADTECSVVHPGAVCDALDAAGIGRCMPPCGPESPCDDGLSCVPHGDSFACAPLDSGFCECGPAAYGSKFGCLVTSPVGTVCDGASLCEATGVGVCEPLAVEDCDGKDDDCDGLADEDFLDSAGRYATTAHCGSCNHLCAAPGANMSATCLVDPADTVLCEIDCLPGYVDVDGIVANGCECFRWNGSGPPPSAGGDGDCDGVPDDSSDFVYVASTGNDSNPGTLAMPKRTLGAALPVASSSGKDVLVARGIYEGPLTLVAGVSIYGGYRPDFRDRNLTLYPVSLVSSGDGAAAMVCRGIDVQTRIDGITIEASDAATSGRGSTAAYFDGCGAAVELVDVTVYAGRGADGVRGQSSAEMLAAAGGGSLADLDGFDGASGTADPSSATCRTINGGAAGTKSCFGVAAHGGNGGWSGCPAIACSNGSPCANAGCTDYTTNGVCDFATVMSLAVPNGPGADGSGASFGRGGEATYNSPTNRGICNFCDDNPTLPRDGVPGADGTPGNDGVGGVGCGVGPSVDVATGLVRGGDGTDGAGGANGSGGGGGSGGSGYEVIGGTTGCTDRPGGSGGGGGSGGCGAPAATAGQGGGASIGLLVRFGSVPAGPTFTRVRVVPVSGGLGGDGGTAADGGSAGAGNVGGRPSFWCARSGGRGGDGGEGGAAGGGGGGCGGGSHGLAVLPNGLAAADYVASTSGLSIDATGRGGSPGAGGFSPGSPGSDGLSGSSAARIVLP